MRWSLFLINFQAYKPATLLQRDSNTSVFLWILKNFKNLYFKGHLWTTASELYWFKVEKIIEKVTIIGDVFKTKLFCKNSCLYITVDYFCKTLHITCFTRLWIWLDKIKQDCNLCKLSFARVFHFKLIHPCSWKLIILVSHYLSVQT